MEYRQIPQKYNYRQEVTSSPLRILGQQTRQSITTSLDSRKLLLTNTRLHRDWRGLAEKAELDLSVIRSSKISFTEHCFILWIQKGALVNDLLEALESIDRFDVIDDTLQLIYDDYDHAVSKDILGLKPIPPPIEDLHSSITDFDANVLTTDDQKNLKDGGTLQFYDALVLFADEDLDFVNEMVQKLEGEYDLKLCLKDRDLVGGLAFELSAIMRLIEERCARVIVVLSPAFLQSNANKFFTQFAHALGVDRQQRIVIPCMYKACEKPPEISFCHSLDYFRTKGYWDYWKKLADSLIYKPSIPRVQSRPTLKPISQNVSPSSASTLTSFSLPSPDRDFPALSYPPSRLDTHAPSGFLALLKKKTRMSGRPDSQVLSTSSLQSESCCESNLPKSSSFTSLNSTVSTLPLLSGQSMDKERKVWSTLKKILGPNKKRKEEPVSA